MEFDGDGDLTGPDARLATEHRTGDLGYLASRARIVLGRSRDMIICGTVNIYPGLHEPRIAALDEVGAAVLVGVQQEDGDERVVLVVTRGSPRSSTTAPCPASCCWQGRSRSWDAHASRTGARLR